MTDPVMTLAEASDYLKISDTVLRRLAKNKEIPAKKVGRQWRFVKTSLDAYLTGSQKEQAKK